MKWAHICICSDKLCYLWTFNVGSNKHFFDATKMALVWWLPVVISVSGISVSVISVSVVSFLSSLFCRPTASATVASATVDSTVSIVRYSISIYRWR